MPIASDHSLQHIWYRSAADHSRQTLFPRGLVLGLAAILLWLLWIIVPTQQLQRQLGNAKQSDALTITYMQSWIAADPSDLEMRFLLSRHLYIAGRQDESSRLIEEVLTVTRSKPGQTELLQNALLLKLSLIEAKAFSYKEGTPERQEHLQAARAWLATMVTQTDDKNILRIYLRRSMALDDSGMSQQIAMRINPRRGLRSPGESSSLAENNASPEAILSTPDARGKDAVANGRWQEAADIYWAMYDSARDNQQRKDLLLLIVRNEQWGNRLPVFFEQLESRLTRIPQDRDTLKKLARLAMAANRLDLADKFVRQLMQFSQGPLPLPGWLAALNPVASAHAETLRPASREELLRRDWDTSQVTRKPGTVPLPKAVFDDETFTVAYQVFLAKGFQEDAYKVAASAVRQAPGHGEWRRRLAQIAEWTQRPEESMEHWLHLAQHPKEAAATKPVLTLETAWGHVKRLSKALNHLPVQVLALEYEQNLNPRNTAIDLAILAIEETLGDTDQAVRRLQKRIDLLGVPANAELLRPLLDLATRLQDAVLIMKTARAMDHLYGPNLERATHVAAILADRGQIQIAFDYLLDLEGTANTPGLLDRQTDRKIRYWSQLAEYAHAMQNEPVALRAYSRGLELGSLDSPDLHNLSRMLEDSSLLNAARVMMQAYVQDKDPKTLTRAGLLWIRADRLDELSQAVRDLPPEHIEVMTSDRNFLKNRASLYQSKGRFPESLADYKAALRLNPKDNELRVGIIWLLIATKNAPMLEQVLRQWRTPALREAEYWGVFGAAYLALGEPQKALPFFARQARQNDDYLWRLSYADALESAGMPDPAWTLRRKAWTEIRKLPEKELRESPEIRERVVALAMQFAPADPARRLLAELVTDRKLNAPQARRQGKDPNAADSAPASIGSIISGSALAESVRQAIDDSRSGKVADTNESEGDHPSAAAEQRTAASEIALSYILSREGYDSAKAWLLTRYANALTQPTWARLSIALATQDRAQVARLLDDLPDWLPRLDQIEALKQVGRTATAQTVAFNTLDSRPGSQEAYNAFRSTLSEDVNVVTLASHSGHFGDVDFKEASLNAKWRFNQRFILNGLLATGSLDWRPAPGNLGPSLPLPTRKAGVNLKAITERGFASVSLEHNTLMRTFNTVQVDWQASFERGWSVQTRAAMHSQAHETPALRVGGMKDVIEMRASHLLTGRDSVSVMFGASRYATQDKTPLGTGFTFVAEYAHQIDKVQPGLSFNVQASHSQFNRFSGTDAITAQVVPAGVSRASDIFLPNSYTQVDVSVSMSEALQNQGRGPLKPFGQIGLRYNTLTGTGYNLRAGLAGSVLGRDSVMLYLQSGSATPGSDRGSFEIGLKYNYFF